MWLLLLLACNTGSLEPVEEVCNGVDDDGDGAVDEDAVDAPTWYRDQDGDGFGSPTNTVRACEAREDWTAEGLDCNDEHAGIHPGAAEIVGDEVDQDCDGAEICYVDADGDGYRPDDSSVVASEDHGCGSSGEALASDPGGDCDDDDAQVHPEAEEVCGGGDEDCDGQVDVDPVDAGTWYPDADGDGFGEAGIEPAICPSPGWAEQGGDCDDQDAWVHPGAPELCDAQDNACDPSWEPSWEAGVVTLFSEDVATDLSAAASLATASLPLTVTVDSDQTLAFCEGSYFVYLTLSGTGPTLTAPQGPGRVTLRSGEIAAVTSQAHGALVQDLSFTGDTTAPQGGALRHVSGDLSIEGCSFEGTNTEGRGGAIYQHTASTLEVHDSIFEGCSATQGGGAIYSAGDLRVAGSTFSDNQADGKGGGAIFAGLGPTVLVDSSFDSNRTTQDGGGVYLATGSLSCTCTPGAPCGFYDNEAEGQGGGAWVSDSVTSTDCDWTDNSPDDLYVDGESYSDLGAVATFTYP